MQQTFKVEPPLAFSSSALLRATQDLKHSRAEKETETETPTPTCTT